MKTFCLSLCLAALYALTLLRPAPAQAYPLDGYASTGIGRLEAARLVAIGARPGKQRPAGELLPLDLVDLRLPVICQRSGRRSWWPRWERIILSGTMRFIMSFR